MKYKIGDKVRVRQWDDMAKEYGESFGSIDIPHFYFPRSVEKYCGEVVTIEKANTCSYNIKEDEEHWYWTDDMFENMYYSCADNITKDLQNACVKVFESILPKYPKHNDMLDTFTKIPKEENKRTVKEIEEMMKENTTAEAKKGAHRRTRII